MTHMIGPRQTRSTWRQIATGIGTAGAAAASYMAWEANWIECRQADLVVPDLPPVWSGLTVLHLSDVHAGSFAGNERNLEKAVRWAEPLSPDLLVLTGDMLGKPLNSQTCLDLLRRLKPPLGKYAVTGNHEYGLSKAPFARPRATDHLWEQADITLLRDRCVTLPPREGRAITLCGADHLTRGYGVPQPSSGTFSVLLTHVPPSSDSALADHFSLAFAGHTHGGQLRLPGPSGLAPLYREDAGHLEGIHRWGQGTLVITRGVGVGFLPFRLFTRPEATLWRLV